MMRQIKTYPYTIGFLLSIAVAIILQAQGVFDYIIKAIGSYSYIASFIAGILFSSTFTSIPALMFFYDLGASYNPWIIAIIGGTGAMIGDLIMYKFIKKSVFEELRALAEGILAKHHREKLENIMKHRVFLFIVPFLASALIASPLPDEIGLALFGLVNFLPRYVSIITLVLNTIGIFVIVLLGHSLHI